MEANRKRRPTSCYWLKMRRATASVTRHYDQALASCGITVNQYSVLLHISRLDRCSIRELADMAELDRSTVARNLKPLYRQKLVVDTKEPGMRNSKLKLTEVGEKTIERAGPLWDKAQEAVFQKLGQGKIEALEAALALLDSA